MAKQFSLRGLANSPAPNPRKISIEN